MIMEIQLNGRSIADQVNYARERFERKFPMTTMASVPAFTDGPLLSTDSLNDTQLNVSM